MMLLAPAFAQWPPEAMIFVLLTLSKTSGLLLLFTPVPSNGIYIWLNIPDVDVRESSFQLRQYPKSIFSPDGNSLFPSFGSTAPNIVNPILIPDTATTMNDQPGLTLSFPVASGSA